MEPSEPAQRPRRGAFPRVELDGSTTLYGVEDWTEVRDDPVIITVERSRAIDGRRVEATDDEAL